MMFMLTGCATKKTTPKVCSDAHFVLNYDSQEFTGDLKFYQDNTLEMCLSSPDALEGLKVRVNKNEAKVSYKALEKEFSLENIPQGAVFKMIYDLFVTVKQKSEFEFDKKDDYYTTTFESDYGEVKLVTNEDDMIKSITIEKSAFNLELTY